MLTTGQWADAAEPIARKSYELGMKELPNDRQMIFDIQSTDKLQETYLELGDIGSMGEFNGGVDYDDMAQGWKMTIPIAQYAKGMKIERILWKTDQINVIKSRAQALGRAARRRISQDTYFIFNNAFSTAITTLDTLQLCSASHVDHANQGAGSHSNYATSAFTAVTVEAVRLAMSKFTTNTGQKAEVDMDMLIIPEDLHEKGYEIISSSGKVDTANNNANFHKGKYKLLVSRWLSDTNNWFGVDSELMKEYMKWNKLDEPEFAQAEDFDGMVAKHRVYMAYGFGVTDHRFILGSEVA